MIGSGFAGSLLLAAAAAASGSPTLSPEDERRLERSCRAGDGAACEELGWLRHRADEVAALRRALEAFRRGCELGEARACASGGEILIRSALLDRPGALALYRRGCELKDDGACHDIVYGYATDDTERRFAAISDARDAMATLETRCRAGAGLACSFLANFAGHGVAGLAAADLSRANAFTEAACRHGIAYHCQELELLRAPGPSAASLDDVREAVVRGLLIRRTRADGSRPLCIALADDGDLEGRDPPGAFLERFRDHPAVRTVEWCRSRQEGDVVALGPPTRAAWPPTEGLAAWHVFYGWNGLVWSSSERYTEKEGAWVPDPRWPSRPGPAVDVGDRSEDRARIAAVVTQYVEAWNRGDPPAAERRHCGHTRLEASPLTIELRSESAPEHASAHVTLRGTFIPRAGAVWPIEPWKQSGAAVTVRLFLSRRDGWWRSGHWQVTAAQMPWSQFRISGLN